MYVYVNVCCSAEVAFQLLMCLLADMKLNVLKGDRYEVNPEDINVHFVDIKGVRGWGGYTDRSGGGGGLFGARGYVPGTGQCVCGQLRTRYVMVDR